MALNTGIFDGGLLSSGWVAHHAPVVESGFRGTVRVSEDISRGTIDLDTGAQVGGSSLVYYEGPGRVQKVRMPKRSQSSLDTEDDQQIHVQIPHGTRLTLPAGKTWKSNLRVEVTACEDPAMVGMVTFVRGWAGSTQAWLTTLTCEFDSREPMDR